MLSETKLAINNIYDRVVSRTRTYGAPVVPTVPVSIAAGMKGMGPNSGVTITFQNGIPVAGQGITNANGGGVAAAAEGVVANTLLGGIGIPRFSVAVGGGNVVNVGGVSVVGGVGGPNASGGWGIIKESDNSAKALAEKLHAIQERVMDLQGEMFL
jgi:hypothetical protein